MFYLKYGICYGQEKKKILLAPEGIFVKRGDRVQIVWTLGKQPEIRALLVPGP